MGHRLLAAVLALLAGLAAQIAPVQARAPDGGRAEIGAVETRVERRACVSRVARAGPVSPLANRWPVAPAPERAVPGTQWGAVAIGSDRALE